MTGQSRNSETRSSFVLDTSVAVKWYLPEELHEEAIGLLRRAEAGEVELLAPGTVQPEFFNTLWWQHQREDLPLASLDSSDGLSRLPGSLSQRASSQFCPTRSLPKLRCFSSSTSSKPCSSYMCLASSSTLLVQSVSFS